MVAAAQTAIASTETEAVASRTVIAAEAHKAHTATRMVAPAAADSRSPTDKPTDSRTVDTSSDRSKNQPTATDKTATTVAISSKNQPTVHLAPTMAVISLAAQDLSPKLCTNRTKHRLQQRRWRSKMSHIQVTKLL